MGPVLLQSLLSVLEGRQETGIRLGKDSATGELSFPDSGLHGEYLDQESWFDWQSRYSPIFVLPSHNDCIDLNKFIFIRLYES